MSVERSERGALITNAYTNVYDDTSIFRIIDSQWQYYDEYGYNTKVLEKRLTLLGDDLSYITGYACNFTGGYSQDAPLQYQFDIFDVDNNRLYSSYWQNVGTPTDCGLITVAPTDGIVYRCRLLVKKTDYTTIYPENMYASAFIWYYHGSQDIEQQTLPSDWFGTTTQTIPTYTTQTTMVTTVDYEAYLSTLTIPVDVRPAIATLDQLINDLWSLHYIPFVVCFALIMGLAIWLLH